MSAGAFMVHSVDCPKGGLAATRGSNDCGCNAGDTAGQLLASAASGDHNRKKLLAMTLAMDSVFEVWTKPRRGDDKIHTKIHTEVLKATVRQASLMLKEIEVGIRLFDALTLEQLEEGMKKLGSKLDALVKAEKLAEAQKADA